MKRVLDDTQGGSKTSQLGRIIEGCLNFRTIYLKCTTQN